VNVFTVKCTNPIISMCWYSTWRAEGTTAMGGMSVSPCIPMYIPPKYGISQINHTTTL
jgi:hypothetical protein